MKGQKTDCHHAGMIEERGGGTMLWGLKGAVDHNLGYLKVHPYTSIVMSLRSLVIFIN